MRNRITLSLLVSILLVSSMAGIVSAGNSVLFYERAVLEDYKVGSKYSQFNNELENAGYEVDPLELELTDDALKMYNPDVLVIPNLASDLTLDELTTLFEFVTKEGKGLFICGATPSVNKFTIPLGMRVDEGGDHILEDESNRIRDMSTGNLVEDKATFYIDIPLERPDPAVRALTRGITKLHFFGGNGIYVFGNAKTIIKGDEDTYSPKSLIFPKRTSPPIAAYVKLGNGTVFLLSDPDMLSNEYLDTAKYRHNNMKFGVNIIDWLSTPFPATDDNDVSTTMKMFKTEITDLTRTLNSLQNNNKNLTSRMSQLESEKRGLQQRVDELEANHFMWFDYPTWAIILLALCILVAALVIMKRGKPGGEGEKGGAGLGYEFGEMNPEDSEFGLDIPEDIKGDEVEERLKEFEKRE
ncbi:MAG: hypothetical protein U9Q22_06490 [Candidatus Altiarchaeota archaeon]|nr:hypothetical protein [Candidatus Altiarchaeota archaeon]